MVYTFMGPKRPGDANITSVKVREGLRLNIGESADLTEAEVRYLSRRFVLAPGVVDPQTAPTADVVAPGIASIAVYDSTGAIIGWSTVEEV